VLELLAQSHKKDAEAIRADAVAAIEKAKLQAPLDAEWAAMIDAIAAFMRHPKTITATATPPLPLTIQGLALVAGLNSPTALRKGLGLSVH